jgi:predicted small lipoprotein YifL
MNLPILFSSRIVMAGMVVLALGACGRRGPLEAPPDAAVTVQQGRQAQAQTEVDEELRDEVVPSPTPTPRRRSRAYTIPKEPFILDPLL